MQMDNYMEDSIKPLTSYSRAKSKKNIKTT